MSTNWTRYYDAAGEQPRETLLFALERFEAEARAAGRELFAVDLGCGSGRDTAELLRRGWRVLAIDAEAEAIERLLARSDLGSAAGRLETQVARFEDAAWPEADLINSSCARTLTCSRLSALRALAWLPRSGASPAWPAG
jgi:tellurite methyltransferase